jgi:hypothetical protein
MIAVALLLISATLLGTASFAWFSMNTSVDVDGIEVEAYSDSLFLEISEDNSTYDTAVTLSNAKATLRPVTHKNLTTGYYLVVTALSGAYVENGVYIATADTEAVDGKTYYVQGYVEVTTAEGDDASGLFVNNGTGYEPTADDEVCDDSTKYYVRGFVQATVDSSTDLTDHYEKVTEIYVKNPATTTGADTYSEKNYEKVTDLAGADEVTGYYKNPTITLVKSGTYSEYVAASGTYDSGVTYYEFADGSYTQLADTSTLEEGVTPMANYFVANTAEYYVKGEMGAQHTYTKATLADGAQLKGYYTVAGAPQYDGALYDGESDYYEKSGNTFALVTDLDFADYLDGYVAIEKIALNLTSIADPTDTADTVDVYVTDNSGYVYVTTANEGDDVSDTLYWARTYSSANNSYEAASTLKVLKKDFGNYYLKKTVYLRCAEKTNDGADLKIADVSVKGADNDFNKALTIVFVATSSSGESAVAVYNNANPNAINGQVLFEKVLGNKQEVVTVEMYVYFDGEATGVMTENVGLIDGQRIEVEFAIKDQPYNK